MLASCFKTKKKMKKREILYKEAISMIEMSTPQKLSILYHNIFSLQLSGNYVFSSKKDIMELVNFLNSYE
jgi:hypothetical protein